MSVLEFPARSFSELKNLALALNNLPGISAARIRYEGDWEQTERIDFRKPISLVGTPGHRLRIHPDVTTAYSWYGTQSQFMPIDPMGSWEERVVMPHEILSLRRGDLVGLRADDVLDVYPHFGILGKNCPFEVHQINHIDGRHLYLQSPAQDMFSEDPRMVVISPLRDFELRDLYIESSGTGEQTQKYSTLFRFQRCARVRLENVKTGREGPGAIDFRSCYDVTMDGCTIEGSERSDTVYGVVFGAVNNALLTKCKISGTRHAVTTTSEYQDTDQKTRWGSAINTVIDGNQIFLPYRAETGTTRVGIDSHPEGRGIVVKNNLVVVGNLHMNVALQTRSRGTVFKGNIVRGGGKTYGMRIYAKDCTAEDNQFHDTWRGIWTVVPHPTKGATYVTGAAVERNTFRRVEHPIGLLDGSGHHHFGNSFVDCGEPFIAE